MSKQVRILYTNWQGKTGYRNIIPKSIEYKSTEWHKEEQWILNAFDVDKEADRGFAIKDIKEWTVLEEVKENNPVLNLKKDEKNRG